MFALIRRFLKRNAVAPERSPEPHPTLPLELLLARFEALPEGSGGMDAPYRSSIVYRHRDSCPSCSDWHTAVVHELVDPRGAPRSVKVTGLEIHRAREHGRPMPRDTAAFLAALGAA